MSAIVTHKSVCIVGFSRWRVALETECHLGLGLDHLEMQFEKSKKIAVCCGAEDNKSGVDIDRLFAWLSDVYGVGITSRAVICS